MKQTSNLFAAGAIALVAGVFSACGGGSGANIPTDGLLGEVPSITATYVPELEQIRSVIFSDASDSKREKAHDEWEEKNNEWKTKVNEAVAALKDKEVPIEAAEGVKIQPTGNLKLQDNQKINSLKVSVNFVCPGKLADFVTIDEYPNYKLVAFDTEGNAIGVKRGVMSLDAEGLNDSMKNNGYKKDSNVEITFWAGDIAENPAAWAKLAKVVIMDSTTEAYKKAEEQVKAAKEAAKTQEQ